MFDKMLLARFGRDPEAVKVALAREFTAFEGLPVALSEAWLEPRAPGKWSAAQVTEHVMKVNVGMSKTLYLLRRDAPLPEQTRVPGVLIEGRAQAPAFSQPGEGLSWRVLQPKWLEVKARFLTESGQVGSLQRTWFHPYFGNLSALDWTRAAAFHMAHHRKQLSVLQR